MLSTDLEEIIIETNIENKDIKIKIDNACKA